MTHAFDEQRVDEPSIGSAPGTDGAGVRVIADWRSARIRSTVDGLRLAGMLALLLVLFGLGTSATATTAGANTDAARAIDAVPNAIATVVGAVGGFGVLVVFMASIVRTLVRGQTRLVIESLVAGVVCLLVVGLLGIAVQHATGALHDALILTHGGGLTAPFDTFLAAWLTFVTVLEIGRIVGGQHLVGATVALYLLSVLAGGLASLISLAMSIALGITIGVTWRYLVGRVNERSDGAQIAAGLARAGLPLATITRVPATSAAVRNYRGDGLDGRAVQVVVLDRDRSAEGWTYRAYRTVRLKPDLTDGPTVSMERVAERRVLLALAARDAGAVLPEYRASAVCGPDTIAIAYDDTTAATPFADLDPPATEAQLRDLWQSAQRLHAAGIAHPHLTPERICVDADGRVLLPIIEDGWILASDLRIALDRAQLLATSAQVAGTETAARIAREALDAAELARAMAVLQPVALSPETRAWLKRDKSVLADLRRAVDLDEGGRAPTAAEIERVRPRTVLTLAGLVVAAWLLIGQLGAVDVVSTLQTADWNWAPLVLVASALTYFAATMTLLAYVRERLPIWRTVISQVATGFVGFVLPPAVGGVGLNVRYLHNKGLSTTAAATSVATNHIGNALCHLALLTIVLAATGSSSDHHSLIPGWAYLVVAGLAAVAMLLLAITPTRRWLLAKALPPIREALPRLLDLASNPAKLAQAIGGAVLLNGTYIAALYFAVQAFHGPMNFATIAVIYLAGVAVGSAAPSPGGLGAIEAALSAGLISAGMPGSSAVSAVLLYRIATFWLPVPVGWLALRWMERKGDL